MKEKLCEVLRVFEIDVLLWELFEKLTLAVTKKLRAVKFAAYCFLTRLFDRNGEGCAAAV